MNTICRVVHAVMNWMSRPLPPDEFIDMPPEHNPRGHDIYYVGAITNGERRWADDD